MKSPARSLRKLAMALGFASILRRGFNSSKCKTEAKLATARIKLLRNKREVQVRQMRRDVAMLIESGREDTARIRVEHVIREQNIMAANEIIELFCELVVVRLPIIAKQRDCPADLKEGISSLIYSAPRCSEIPELQRISDIFEKKYGKDFVTAAADLRPESGVNRLLIEKLSVRKPVGEVKIKILKEIAKEYRIDWDPAESEKELLKPPEELIEGPRSFVSASSIPVKPTLSNGEVQVKDNSLSGSKGTPMQFMDTALAAQAAADAAETAVSAARAAAYLAKQSSSQQNSSAGSQSHSLSSTASTAAYNLSTKKFSHNLSAQSLSRSMNDEDMDSVGLGAKQVHRGGNHEERSAHSEIKFDDSDGLDSDDDFGTNTNSTGSSHPPPNRPPPILPRGDQPEARPTNSMGSRVHPKLPDYETLAACFEALKSPRF